MAPREDPSSRSRDGNGDRLTLSSSVGSSMIADGSCEKENDVVDRTDNSKQSKRSGLVQMMRKWLFEYRDSLQQQDDDSRSQSTSRRYHVAATVILTFASLYAYRNRRVFKSRMLPALLYMFQRQDYQKAATVSLSFLRSVAAKGLVERALVSSSGIIFFEKNRGDGKRRGVWRKSVLPPNSANLQSDLLEALAKGGCSDVSALPESLLSRLSTPLLAALPFVYLAIMARILKNLHGGEDVMPSIQEDRGCTTFRDVAGLDHIQHEVAEVVSYLADPGKYRQMGAKPPKGILLYGPPGSGKTLLAKAVAGEAKCDTFIACSGSEFCEMFVGRGAARVRSLFGRARSSAKAQQKGQLWSWLVKERVDNQKASAIIFIDEFDALAKSRSYGLTGNDERDQTLNQLLTEMDGFPTQQNDDVAIIVIAATNRADSLDPAILRRFDRQIHVGYPSAEGRRDIFLVHSRRIRCNLDEIDWDELASDELTSGFLGADIQNVVNDAALLAVREQCSAVNHGHLLKAVQRSREMKGNISSASARGVARNLFFNIPQI